LDLFFRKYGKGKPLIIIHGLYGSSDNWITIGKALAEHFEVYLIDLRNHGHSPHSDEHSYALMANDLLEFIQTQNLIKPILIGHSMGGKTAMFFAALYADLLSKLVVIDISPRSYQNDKLFLVSAKMHENIITAMEKFDLSAFKSWKELEESLPEEYNNFIGKSIFLKNIKQNANKTYSWKLNISAIKNSLPNILDGLDENTIINIPCLFVKGANSNYILEKDAELIYKIFPQAKLETISNASHWIHVDQPYFLITTLLNFTL